MIRRSGGETTGRPPSASSFMTVSRGKKIWTVEEDEQLKNLVASYGTGNWTLIAQSLPERTGKQCRERWHNHLGSGIKKGDWTEEEDKIIVTMQRHIGNQWAKITKMLPGRTDNAVKNRFHATERAKSRSKGDDQFNAQADQEFFDKLKKLHPDVDFDLLCEQHASAMLNGGHTTDQSSVDNARTSSITGSDASSRNGSRSGGNYSNNNNKRTRLNDLTSADDYDGEHDHFNDDEALSEEENEEDGEYDELNGEHEDDGLGIMLEDTLMDIDIINFDQDDVLDLDFDFGDSAINAPNDTSRGPTAGDNCCLGFFDWGCSTYYKNVFNPGAEKNKKKSGLPNGSDRPEVYNGTESNNLVDDNFYNLPPAVELTPTPSSSQLQFAQQQQQQQQQQALLIHELSPQLPQSPQQTQIQHLGMLTQQQLQQQQQLQHHLHQQAQQQQFAQAQQMAQQQQQQQQQQQYGAMTGVPNQPIMMSDGQYASPQQYAQQVQQVQYTYPAATFGQPQFQVAYHNGQQVYIPQHPYPTAAAVQQAQFQYAAAPTAQNLQNLQNIQNLQNMQNLHNMQFITGTYSPQFMPVAPTQQIGIGQGLNISTLNNHNVGSNMGTTHSNGSISRPVSTSSFSSNPGSYNNNDAMTRQSGSYTAASYLA